MENEEEYEKIWKRRNKHTKQKKKDIAHRGYTVLVSWRMHVDFWPTLSFILHDEEIFY